MHQMTPLTDDHAYTWRGYGDYCGRCLRDRQAPRWDLTPMHGTKGGPCRSCGTLLRSSHHTNQAGLARIRALTGADQAAPTLAAMDQPRERYGLPPAHTGLRDPRRGRVACYDLSLLPTPH